MKEFACFCTDPGTMYLLLLRRTVLGRIGYLFKKIWHSYNFHHSCASPKEGTTRGKSSIAKQPVSSAKHSWKIAHKSLIVRSHRLQNLELWYQNERSEATEETCKAESKHARVVECESVGKGESCPLYLFIVCEIVQLSGSLSVVYTLKVSECQLVMGVGAGPLRPFTQHFTPAFHCPPIMKILSRSSA